MSRLHRVGRALTSRRFWSNFNSEYKPRPLDPWVGVFLSWLIAVLGLVRGMDLLTSPVSTSKVNDYVDLLGVHLWASAVLFSSVGLILGLGLRRLGWIWCFHVAGVLVFSGYGIATLQGALEAGSGYRFAASLLGGAALHGLRIITLLPDVTDAGEDD